MDIDRIVDAYLNCMVWADCTSDHDESFEGAELSEQAKRSARDAVRDFCALMGARMDELRDIADDSQIGHDLWLTRNGHGAGFWDRGYGELGDFASAQAKSLGTADPYVGDDGLIYVS